MTEKTTNTRGSAQDPKLLDLLRAAARLADPATPVGSHIASACRAMGIASEPEPAPQPPAPTPASAPIPADPARVAMLGARAPTPDGKGFDLVAMLLRAEPDAAAIGALVQSLGRSAAQGSAAAVGKRVECALLCFDSREARESALSGLAPLARWDLPDQPGLDAPSPGFEGLLARIEACARAVPAYDAHVAFEQIVRDMP